ncbi:DUF4238 domain-containing protein [Nocardia carnea]|uniref:DUF4238 domain-containing protein n=1 Tax=Nocardia carnea TaxID=37328 RepID=UPI002454BAD5|nr:DUF4238 domain-containing protein [Nocardia carnea]
MRNEAGTPARKHHLVPASYLRRWAEDDSKGRSKLRVTEIDRATSYCVGPDNAAREPDFYRVEHPDLDPAKVPPSLFETHLSKIERNAKHAISALIEHRATYSLGPERFVLFAWHLAYTATRGRAFRARMNAVATAHYRLIAESTTDATIAARIRGLGEDPTPELVASCRRVFDDVRDGKLIARHDESAVILLSVTSAGAGGTVSSASRSCGSVVWVMRRWATVHALARRVRPVSGSSNKASSRWSAGSEPAGRR